LLSAFPNPTTNKLNLSCELGIDKIHLYGSNGQLVKQISFTSANKQLSIDLSNLQSGLYLLNAFTEVGIINKEVVIE